MTNPHQLRQALAQIPTPLVSVAALISGKPVGMTVGSFVGVSLEPALVSLSIQKSSQTWELLRHSRRIGISVLDEKHRSQVRELAGPQEHRFDNLLWQNREEAVLIADSRTSFIGEILSEVDAGDHIIAIVQIREILFPNQAENQDIYQSYSGIYEDAEPLVFYQSRITSMSQSRVSVGSSFY